LWVLGDIQTVKYFDLVGDEEDIENERFKRSRASTFSYNRNVIGLAVTYASAIRTHLSVHGTAHHTSAASVRPRSAADSLIRSAVDISHPRQQGNPPVNSSAISASVRSDIIIDLGAGTVGGGVHPSLVSSMPPGVLHGPDDSVSALHPRTGVTTCLRKVKHCVTAPLRVPRLAVPPLALTVSTRKPMFARMPPSWIGMPMSVRAL